MRPIPASRLGDAHGLLRVVGRRGRLRLDELLVEDSADELFPPGLQNALGRTRQFTSFARAAGLMNEDRGTVELTDMGKRYVRAGDPERPWDVSPGQAEWLQRLLRERQMTDSIYHGAAIGLSLYASLRARLPGLDARLRPRPVAARPDGLGQRGHDRLAGPALHDLPARPGRHRPRAARHRRGPPAARRADAARAPVARRPGGRAEPRRARGRARRGRGRPDGRRRRRGGAAAAVAPPAPVQIQPPEPPEEEEPAPQAAEPEPQYVAPEPPPPAPAPEPPPPAPAPAPVAPPPPPPPPPPVRPAAPRPRAAAPSAKGVLSAGAVEDSAEARDLRLPAAAYAAVAAALATGRHLLLTGPPGSGKTTLALAVGDAAMDDGLAAAVTLVTARRPRGGAPTADLLLAAAREDCWVVLDELDRARPDRALGELSSFLGGVPVVLDADDEAAPGTGASSRTATRVPPASGPLLRRFAVVAVPPPDAQDMEEVLHAAAGGHPGVVAAVRRLLPARELGPVGHRRVRRRRPLRGRAPRRVAGRRDHAGPRGARGLRGAAAPRPRRGRPPPAPRPGRLTGRRRAPQVRPATAGAGAAELPRQRLHQRPQLRRLARRHLREPRWRSWPGCSAMPRTRARSASQPSSRACGAQASSSSSRKSMAGRRRSRADVDQLGPHAVARGDEAVLVQRLPARATARGSPSAPSPPAARRTARARRAPPCRARGSARPSPAPPASRSGAAAARPTTGRSARGSPRTASGRRSPPRTRHSPRTRAGSPSAGTC